MITGGYESRGMGMRFQSTPTACFGAWHSTCVHLSALWYRGKSVVCNVRYAELAQVPVITRGTTSTYIESKPAGGRAGVRPLPALAEAPTSTKSTPQNFSTPRIKQQSRNRIE